MLFVMIGYEGQKYSAHGRADGPVILSFLRITQAPMYERTEAVIPNRALLCDCKFERGPSGDQSERIIYSALGSLPLVTLYNPKRESGRQEQNITLDVYALFDSKSTPASLFTQS